MFDASKRPRLVPPPQTPATASRAQLRAKPALRPSQPAPRRDATSADPAEVQADAIGEQIGRDLRSARGVASGPLPRSVGAVAEKHLGVDLTGTELRDDAAANRHAESMSALAVTEGSRVSFARDRLSVATAEGRSLIGHELTHVAQQRAFGITAEQRQAADAGATSGTSPKAPASPPPPAPFTKSEVSLGFDIPGGRVLKSEMGVDVVTTSKTRIFLSLDKRRLSLSFSPPLHVNIPLLPDVEVEFARWDVKTGETDATARGPIGPSLGVEYKMEIFMEALVVGTPLAALPYDYNADPDPFGTLQKVASNLEAGAAPRPRGVRFRCRMSPGLA